jgi:ferritin-like metal-binding protein YciE
LRGYERHRRRKFRAIQEKKGEEAEAVLDVAIAGGARRVEHYEIAGYSAAIEMARKLGHEEAAGMIEETLQEEQEADEKLAEISKRILTEAAAAENSATEEGGEDAESGRSRTKPKPRAAG